MSQISQKDAVFKAVTSVLSANNIPFEQGMNVGTVMTRELRAQVNNILFEAFRLGTVKLDCEYNDTDLKVYVSGLQSNWLRKDTRLNGAIKFVLKNPGSRKFSSDPQIKELNKLLSTVTSEADKAEIQSHIDARIAELSK